MFGLPEKQRVDNNLRRSQAYCFPWLASQSHMATIQQFRRMDIGHLFALSAAIVASFDWLRMDEPRWKLTTVMQSVIREPNAV